IAAFLVGIFGAIWLTRDTTRPVVATQQIAAAPARIHWSVSSLPPGAEIRRSKDGILLGKTPWQDEVDASAGSEEIRRPAAGHPPSRLSLRRDRDTERAVMLVADKSSAATPEAHAPPEKAPTGKPTVERKTGDSEPVAPTPTESGPRRRKPK